MMLDLFSFEARTRLCASAIGGVMACVACVPDNALAHKASDAYLHLSQQGAELTLRWDVALRDLDVLLPVDRNDDGQITWGEVRASQVDVQAHLLRQWQMQPKHSAGGPVAAPCVFSPQQATPALERRQDGTYQVLTLRAHCPSPSGQYQVRYSLMQGVDPTHRGLMNVVGARAKVVSLSPQGGWQNVTLVAMPVAAQMAPLPPAQHLGYQRVAYQPDLGAAPSVPPTSSEPTSTFAQMWADGVHHILIGTDHVLFLLCLLLPAVLQRQRKSDGTWGFVPVAQWREALGPVVMTVTMFTLAHSITLALAALKLVSISPRVIEPAIAVTIALAAIDNVRSIFRGRRNLFTFLFGLIHGFGFAGVLAELNLPVTGFMQAVLAFNLGVESGQLLIVLPAMALLMALRHWPGYARRLVPAGSALAVAVAAGWFVERVFDMAFMPL